MDKKIPILLKLAPDLSRGEMEQIAAVVRKDKVRTVCAEVAMCWAPFVFEAFLTVYCSMY